MNRERIEAALYDPEIHDPVPMIDTLIREAVDEALEAAAVEIEALMVGNTRASTITPAGAARIVRSHKGAE